MMVILAAVAAVRSQLANRIVARARRWRIGTHFVLQLKGYLCTEGLTGMIGWRDFHWLTGGLRNGFGYISLAGKGGIAFDQVLRPPRLGSPLALRCLRLETPVMTDAEFSASLERMQATSHAGWTLATV